MLRRVRIAEHQTALAEVQTTPHRRRDECPLVVDGGVGKGPEGTFQDADSGPRREGAQSSPTGAQPGGCGARRPLRGGVCGVGRERMAGGGVGQVPSAGVLSSLGQGLREKFVHLAGVACR